MTTREIEHIEGAATLDRDTATRTRKTVTHGQFWAGIGLTIAISTCTTYLCTNQKSLHYGLNFFGHGGESVAEASARADAADKRAANWRVLAQKGEARRHNLAIGYADLKSNITELQRELAAIPCVKSAAKEKQEALLANASR